MRALLVSALFGLPVLAGLPLPPTAPLALPAQAGLGDPVPTPGSATAVAVGSETVIAWLEGHREGARVMARAGGGPAQRLGPSGSGVDAGPVATALGDGSVVVAASRSDQTGERLWSQRWTNAEWQEAVGGPFGAALDHHPALAAAPGSGSAWVAWIGEEFENRSGRALFASRSAGDSWGAAEPLPRAVGAPTSPTIAVDAAGAPIVAWAANDGNDAEIWISRRVAGRWSAPVPLTNNDVPDVMPSLAVAAERVVLTWMGYAGDGYSPRVRIHEQGRWGETTTLDDEPGSRPRAAALDARPAVFWRRLQDGTAGGTISGRRLGAAGWGPTAAVTAASGSPFGLASNDDGRVVLSWTRPSGTLATLSGRRSGGDDAWEALMYAAARARDIPPDIPSPRAAVDGPGGESDRADFPAVYSAFGDSIANGVVVDPDRRESEGYRRPLQMLLRGFFGVGTVGNAGVDGESTADGLGRIDNVVRDQDPDVVLIMQGTNDVFADLDEQTIAFNLRRIVERAREESPSIRPFLAQLPPRNDPGLGFEGSFNQSVALLNTLLVPLAAELDIPLVDQNTPFQDNPDLFSDALHPSVAGYEVMSEVWYDSIKPVVLDTTSRGDVDDSGRTDGIDLVRLALSFGAIAGEPRYNSFADFNRDGIVNGFDLNLLIDSFGRTHSESDS